MKKRKNQFNQSFDLTILCILIAATASFGDDNEQYAACSRPFMCVPQTLQDIRYPFWGDSRPQYCGRQGFELRCNGSYSTIEIRAQNFRVFHINTSHQTMNIAPSYLFGDPYCTQIFRQAVVINHNLFSYSPLVRNLSLYYDCSGGLSSAGKNKFSCEQIDAFYTINEDSDHRLQNLSNTCNKVVTVPFQWTPPRTSDQLLMGELIEVLKQGFEVRYQIAGDETCASCSSSNGICGSNVSSNEFACLCHDRPRTRTCPPTHGDKPNVRMKAAIGIGAAFGGMGIMAAIFLIYLHRNKRQFYLSSFFSRNTYPDPSLMVDFEKGDNILGVHVFTYSELEKATNNFDSAKELGNGGFGTVYYGKLQDGRAVAVKRLYQNNYRRVEQFMNEVEILAHLRHQNLVSLYGCTSRNSHELLLVYEYIPNGTVADHLHGDRVKPGALPWLIRLEIAIDTASALRYLHASDIIHRDVKTNNILLDNNFCVKVADFGLSRLFPNDVSHISTTPQGTPGYVDPEYHQNYQLTDKSDVFSFGVVLIELISSMPAVDITRHRHEINLSNLAINKIQNRALHELVDKTLGYESDYKVRKMIDAVAELAFQCLQSEKDMRPSMADVLETLKDIQSDGYNKEKAEEILKKSPDSVTHIWTSTETAPSFSN